MKNLHIIISGLFALSFFWKTGNATICMNCTSASLAPTAGCHEDFSDEFLIECEETETFCQVIRYEGSFGGSELIQYERTCAKRKVEKCALVNTAEYDGVSCTYTCEGDGCNGMNVFPNEPEFTTTLSPLTEAFSMVDETSKPYDMEPETTAEIGATGEPETTPEWGASPEPDSTPESVPEYSTPRAEPPVPDTSSEPRSPPRCFNCSSNTYDPTDGCHGDDFSDGYLTKCAAEDQYCLITRMSTDVEGAEYSEYSRTCSPVAVAIGCEILDYDYYSVTKCVYTCNTDGCNTLNIFPGEDGYTPPTTAPLEATTTPSGATQIHFNIYIVLHLLSLTLFVLF
uniref:uncharacterized protein LOC120345276 n=1 Tax=Styela clava TaxID=7725 RepID=UPI001939AAF9|nr:uncharacterized protein LOC120345276 [Styela clava]